MTTAAVGPGPRPSRWADFGPLPDVRVVVPVLSAFARGGEPALLEALGRPGAPAPSAFSTYVDAHRLVGWVAPAISDAARPRAFGAAFAAALPERLETERARCATLRAEAAEIDDAFGDAGIEWRLLKGLALGVRLYADPARRWHRDTDVLVRDRDRERALEALERIGFAREEGRVGEGAVRRGLRRGRSMVDLHWNLRRRTRRRLGDAELWEARSSAALDGRTYATLSDEYALTFLLVGMAGDLRRGACPKRHWVDLLLFLRALDGATDWEAFFGRRRAQALEKPCVNVIAVLFATWGAASDLPRLAAAMEVRRRAVEIDGTDEAFGLLVSGRDAPENDAWFRRAYPYDPVSDWARRWLQELPRTLRRLVRPPTRLPGRPPEPRT